MSRVVYVSRSCGPHDQRWVDTLREGGHEVTPYARASIARQHLLDLAVCRWNDAGDLRRAAESADADVFVAGPLTDAAAVAVDADVVPTLGISWAFDLLIEGDEGSGEATLRRIIPRLAGVHVDSYHLADVVRRLGAAPERVSVAPWGIDTHFFTPGPVDRTLLSEVGGEDTRVIFSARSWSDIYDVLTVVRAFALVRECDPSVHLVLGGTGPQDAQVRAEISRLNLAPSVLLVGQVDHDTVRGWLRSADVYVSAARSDGTSLSLLEAMSVGVPSVVSDIVTNREWVVDRGVGRLFPVGNADAMAEAILNQLRCEHRRSRSEGAARRRTIAVQRGSRARNQRIFLEALGRVLELAK